MLENRDVFLKIIEKLKSIANNIGTAIPDVSQIETDLETVQTSVEGLIDDSYFKAEDEVTPPYVPAIGVANTNGTSIAFTLRLNKSMKNVAINSNTLTAVSLHKYDGETVTSPSIISVSKSGDYDIVIIVSASVTAFASYTAYFNGKIAFANPA